MENAAVGAGWRWGHGAAAASGPPDTTDAPESFRPVRTVSNRWKFRRMCRRSRNVGTKSPPSGFGGRGETARNRVAAGAAEGLAGGRGERVAGSRWFRSFDEMGEWKTH